MEKNNEINSSANDNQSDAESSSTFTTDSQSQTCLEEYSPDEEMESLRLAPSTGNNSESQSLMGSKSNSPLKKLITKDSVAAAILQSTELILSQVSKRLSKEAVPDVIESFECSDPDIEIVGEFNKNNDSSMANTSKKIFEISGNSDIHILDDTPEKSSENISNSETKSLGDSVEIVSADGDTSLAVLNDSEETKNEHTYKMFKNVREESDKFISPVYLPCGSSDHMNFDIRPAYSTPNEVKTVPDSKSDNDSSLQIHSSTESLLNLPPMQKKVAICVEISTVIHMGKELWTGELVNVVCDAFSESSVRRLSDSSGNLADISKSTSPSSAVSSSLTTLPLKTTSRFSVVSSSSSSSVTSSASTLARMLREGKLFSLGKKEDVKLTEERISELKEKWLNSNEIYKVLDFIDRIILNSDCITNDDSLKIKHTIDEPTKEALPKIEESSTPVSTNKIRPTRGKRQTKVKFTPAESESDVPKKRQRRAESTEVPSVSTNFSEGDSIFAKWADRKFYAATLSEMTPDGKWQVNFFDGDKKTLLEEFLIKAEEFTMVGHNVYASQGDDNFAPGIITGCELKNGVLQYIVARDKGDISVPYQFIYITETQARHIRGKSSSSTGMRTPTKSTENNYNAASKRSTRSKTRLLLDSPKPSSSGTQLAVLSDSDDDGNDDANEINLEDVAGVEPESHGVYENGIKLKGKTLTGKMRFSRAIDADASILGPVPDEGSKYFKNLHILLTCTRPQSPKLQVTDANSSGNGTSTDSETYNFSSVPFVKDRLKLQLQMGGASVYNNFDDIPQKMWKSTYLISNRPNISAKYIQCISAGIKCVCHEWVIRCCVEKKRVPIQELPLGWSLERDRFFNSFDKKSSSAMKKLHLCIVDTGDKNFYKFWSKICRLAEINVLKLTRDSNLDQINAIISDSGYRDDHVERALSHNIPLVTTTWLIQSLLHGEPRQYDGHKSYMADYVDSE